MWKYSRFARNRKDSIIYKAMLRKVGVQVVSITEPFEDTPTDRLLEVMIASPNDFYSANLGEEVTRGMKESASRCFYVASFAPYGYRKVKVKDGSKDGTMPKPKPHLALAVQRLFAEVIQGNGLVEIAKNLNNEGVTGPRGKNWGKTTIYKILTMYTMVGSRGLEPLASCV